MSFILDALKKSDKKRQDATAPRLDTVHAPSVKRGPGKSLWLLLLGVILLLNICLIGWYFLRSQDVAVVESSRPQSAEIIVKQAPVTSSSVPAGAKAPPRVVPQQQSVSQPAAQQQPARPSSEQRVYAISELPDGVQRRIPPLHMSLHAYNKTNPAAGMVRVNERILRPGAQLDGKYLLEEISEDGAVFLFEGHRFLLPRD